MRKPAFAVTNGVSGHWLLWHADMAFDAAEANLDIGKALAMPGG